MQFYFQMQRLTVGWLIQSAFEEIGNHEDNKGFCVQFDNDAVLKDGVGGGALVVGMFLMWKKKG